MANTIDWQRCYEELEAKFPQIKSRLEEKVVSLLDSSLVAKSRREGSKVFPFITLEEKPPRVSLVFNVGEGISNIEREFEKKRIQIGEAVGAVATEFNMRAYAGRSGYRTSVKKRVWTSDSSGKYYELRPDYQDYKM